MGVDDPFPAQCRVGLELGRDPLGRRLIGCSGAAGLSLTVVVKIGDVPAAPPVALAASFVNRSHTHFPKRMPQSPFWGFVPERVSILPASVRRSSTLAALSARFEDPFVSPDRDPDLAV